MAVKQVTEEEKAELSAPEFVAFFASDIDAEPATFTVQGRECTVFLKKMDSGLQEKYDTLGLKVKQTETGSVYENDEHFPERAMFLVSNTVVDWSIWRRQKPKDGEPGAWELCRPPEDERQRIHFIKQQFKCDSDPWKWLKAQCERVNGFTGATAKN